MSSEDLEPAYEHRYLPAMGDADGRTLILLHGTGGNEFDMLPIGREIGSDSNLLSLRGNVLENGNARFFRRIAEGVFDLDDLKRRSADLVGFLGFASDTYSFDRRRAVAVGYSNGANIAAAVLLLHPESLCSAVLFRPQVPLIPDAAPELSGTPVFIGAGHGDPLVPGDETERLARILGEAGAEVTVHWSDTGHALSHEDITSARRWLESTRACGAVSQ